MLPQLHPALLSPQPGRPPPPPPPPPASPAATRLQDLLPSTLASKEHHKHGLLLALAGGGVGHRSHLEGSWRAHGSASSGLKRAVGRG
jgi:hypothetical protein